MHLDRIAALSLVLAITGCSAAGAVDDAPASGGDAGMAGTAGLGGKADAAGGSGNAAGVGGSGGQGGTGAIGGSAGAAGTPNCPPVPTCDASPPDPGSKRGWNHTIQSSVTALQFANHRGRDLVFRESDEQWIIARFAYGVLDDDLQGEDVDIYLLRNCTGSWEKLATVTATEENDNHPTVENVQHEGGRVYYKLPAAQKLGVGRHRVHFVVGGDLTTTEAFIEVVEPGTEAFVSDIDGTLTTSEFVEFKELLTGSIPDVNPDAAKAQNALAAKGYLPIYLTARPEFLVGRTREFLDTHGFPRGIVQTNTNKSGALGAAAVGYKTGALQLLVDRGVSIVYAFGNSDSDAEAFHNLNIERPLMYQHTDANFGQRRFESYTELLPEFAVLPPVCN